MKDYFFFALEDVYEELTRIIAEKDVAAAKELLQYVNTSTCMNGIDREEFRMRLHRFLGR